MRIYYINLDRHSERRAHMESQLGGLDAERVPATDAQNWTQTERGLTRFEIACLHSHRAVWRRFLDSGAAFACILEDDVIFSPDFPSLIKSERWIPADADAIKLDTFFNKVMLDKDAHAVNGRRLALLHTRHESSAGYIVSRKGADRFLRITEKATLPVDYVIFPEDPRARGLAVYQLTPALLIQDSLHRKSIGAEQNFSSSIQQVDGGGTKKKLAFKARREVGRLYKQIFKTRRYLRDRLLKGLKPEIVPFR
jgi:glycosyl transferase family 25